MLASLEELQFYSRPGHTKEIKRFRRERILLWALSDTAFRPSVCLSVRLSVPRRSSPRRAAALGYKHAGCLQFNHLRTADLSADGRRSAASRTAIGGGRRPPGR